MAVESIGSIYSVNIPGLTDAADIQAAFQAYHYGAYTSIAATANIGAGGLAYWLKAIDDDIALLEARPSSGGDATSSAPVAGDFTPSGVPDGYIWVDFDGSMTSSVIGATAIYNNNAPTSNITSGIIWVDKDATTSTSGNPFIPLGMINNKGDLFVGSTSNTVVILESALTSGYFLTTDTSTTSGLKWDIAVGDLTAISSGTGITVTNGGGPIVTLAIDTATVATLTGTQTLTNKTIDAASNTLTGVTTLTGTQTLTNKTIDAASNTLTGVTTLTGTQTLTNKTITSALNTTPILSSPEERWNVVAAAASGTVNFDANTSGILYYTSNAAGNWTLNVRGDGSTSLNTMLVINDSITVVFFVTNGGTAYYQTGFQVDGNAVTPKWQNGTAPTAGNINSTDIYSFTIVKTGNAAFTAFGSQTKFA